MVVLCLLWWQRERHVFVQTLQPEYEVTQMDFSAQTMVLQRANHRYIVKCEKHCSLFSTGKAYQLRNIVNGLQFKRMDLIIVLPIVQEDVMFPTEGGKG